MPELSAICQFKSNGYPSGILIVSIHVLKAIFMEHLIPRSGVFFAGSTESIEKTAPGNSAVIPDFPAILL